MPTANRVSVYLFLLVPLLLGSKCKKEPEPEPDIVTPDIVVPPEVELQVVSIDPANGTENQSFSANVYGASFEQGARVMLSSIEVARVARRDENTLAITVPPLASGTYDVSVQNPDGDRAVLRRGLTITEPVVTVNCNHLTLYFDYNQSDLRGDAMGVLAPNVGCLSNTRGTIRVEGHTDERGTTEYNVALGQRRAYAVQRYLVSQGISPSRVNTVSYGEERPAMKGSGEDNWSRNRRAEILLQD